MRHIEYKIIQTDEEQKYVESLIYRTYIKNGLINQSDNSLWITSYHKLPETYIFVAKTTTEILATITLITDNEKIGLPLDSAYRTQINKRRKINKKLAEISSLVFNKCDVRDFQVIFLNITKFMIQYGIKKNIEEFIIGAHPRHARFYKKRMGFKQFGNTKEYPLVQNKLVVPCYLNIEHIHQNRPQLYNEYKTFLNISELV